MDFEPGKPSLTTYGDFENHSLSPMITSPPPDAKNSSLSLLISYGWAVLFLFVIYLGVQIFPFLALKNQIASLLTSGREAGITMVGMATQPQATWRYLLEGGERLTREESKRGTIFSFKQTVAEKASLFSETLKNTTYSGRELSLGAVSGMRIAGASAANIFSSGADFFIYAKEAVLLSVVNSFKDADVRLGVANQAIGHYSLSQSELKIGSTYQSFRMKLSQALEPDKRFLPATALVSREADYVQPARFSLWVYLDSIFSKIVMISYIDQITPTRVFVSEPIVLGVGWVDFLIENVRLSWKDFFNQVSSLTEKGDSVLSGAAEEMSARDIVTTEDSNMKAMFDANGIVLLKPSGSSTIDLRNLKKIQDSFSDRVIVNFDRDGQTGKIQPIFRDRAGEEFIFVITPVRE